MSEFLQVHPSNPEDRIIKQVVNVLLAGGVIVYPTDSTYALGCHLGDKNALDRIRRIRQLGASTISPWSVRIYHPFLVMLRYTIVRIEY